MILERLLGEDTKQMQVNKKSRRIFLNRKKLLMISLDHFFYCRQWKFEMAQGTLCGKGLLLTTKCSCRKEFFKGYFP